jgi:PAS domain S-box-containing protein
MKASSGIVQSIVDSLQAGIWVVNRNLEIRWINTRAFRYLGGKELSALEGKHCYEEIFGFHKPCRGCPVLKTFESGHAEHADIRREQDGQFKRYRLTTTPLRKQGSKSFSHVTEMIQDVSAHRKAEDELGRLNWLNKAIIDNAPVAIFTIDKKGEFTSVNPALASISGLGPRTGEKLIGFNWLNNPYTIKCGLAGYIRRGLQGEPFQLWDFPFLTYRGDRAQTIDFKGVPLKGAKGRVEGLLCIIEETTDRVRTRAQLMQEAKMAAIGRLTAGVAHELNNPLATLAAYSELARGLMEKAESARGTPDLAELHSYLEVMEEQTFRCKTIIKDLFDLSRREGFEVVELDANHLLTDVLRLIDFRKLKMRVKKSLAEGLPPVKADPSALRQVFVNVISNAIDAVEDKPKAGIEVRSFFADGQVRIECRDNGMGIPEGIADKIFEPFFTTKEGGKGIGLGLALCYELLDKMGGRIEAESEPGKGSVFRISLPAREEAS